MYIIPSDCGSYLPRKLLTQLENFKTSKDSPSGKTKSSDKSSTGEDCIKYELFYKPELSKHHQATKVCYYVCYKS